MRISIAFYTILILVSSLANASNDNYPVGSRSAAMANASVILSDIWSVHHNQAGLAFVKNLAIGFHHENKFLVEQYGLQSLAIAIPVKRGVFGANFSYFGFSKYNEIKAGLSFAKPFSDKFSAGIQFDYVNTYIADGYGNQGTIAVECGILSQPMKNLFIGAHVFNPTRAKIENTENEKIPTIFRIGAGYNFSDKALLSIETEKDIDFQPVYKTGIEFSLIKNLLFRAGFSTNPNQSSFGIGYIFSHIKGDIAFSIHPQLGVTPHFTLSYEF